MKQKPWNRAGKILTFAILCSVYQGLCATVAGEPVGVFVPTDGKMPLEGFKLVVKGQELDPQEFLKFDFSQAHDGIPSIKLTSKAGEDVRLSSTAPIVLKPGQRYVLRVWVKFTDLIPIRDEQRPRSNSLFIIYVRSTGSAYRVARIGPSTESDGWVKVFLPFDSGQPNFDKVKVDFRLLALQGSIWIYDPRIVEVPENFPHDRFFELPSGEKVSPLVLNYHGQP